MSKLSKNAFAIMAMCENTKEPFGITVDPREGSYAFACAFKIKKEQAKSAVFPFWQIKWELMISRWK